MFEAEKAVLRYAWEHWYLKVFAPLPSFLWYQSAPVCSRSGWGWTQSPGPWETAGHSGRMPDCCLTSPQAPHPDRETDRKSKRQADRQMEGNEQEREYIWLDKREEIISKEKQTLWLSAHLTMMDAKNHHALGEKKQLSFWRNFKTTVSHYFVHSK